MKEVWCLWREFFYTSEQMYITSLVGIYDSEELAKDELAHRDVPSPDRLHKDYSYWVEAEDLQTRESVDARREQAKAWDERHGSV